MNFYWLWDKKNKEWTVGEKYNDFWSLIGTDYDPDEKVVDRDFIVGDRINQPPDIPNV